MFTIEIKTDNDAFQPSPVYELRRILREIIKAMDGGPWYESEMNGTVRDENGNTVGKWELK